MSKRARPCRASCQGLLWLLRPSTTYQFLRDSSQILTTGSKNQRHPRIRQLELTAKNCRERQAFAKLAEVGLAGFDVTVVAGSKGFKATGAGARTAGVLERSTIRVAGEGAIDAIAARLRAWNPSHLAITRPQTAGFCGWMFNVSSAKLGTSPVLDVR
jgi:hypothetical protein